MPAQDRIWLHDQQCGPPVRKVAGQQHEKQAIAWLELSLFDLAIQDQQLLTQKRIFDKQVTFAARDITDQSAYSPLGGGHRLRERF